MAYAPIIRYGGNTLFEQPYDLQQVRAYGFALEGDGDKMQGLVNKTLNLGGEERYSVVSSTVFMTFLEMQHVRSAVAPDSLKGSYHETEVNLQFLMAGREEVLGISLPTRAVWYMPYLWIDSTPPMIAGREIYGFPKQYGSVRMPAAEGTAADFLVETEVLHPYAPNTRSRVAPLISARRTDASHLEFLNHWPDLHSAAAEAIDHLLGLEKWMGRIAGAFLGDLPLPHLFNLAFLRQLPSIEDGSKACYQSVAEAPFEITKYRGAGLLKGDYEVNIFGYDSCPIASELGLATDGSGNVRAKARFGYHYNIDFRLLKGQELWVAGEAEDDVLVRRISPSNV